MVASDEKLTELKLPGFTCKLKQVGRANILILNGQINHQNATSVNRKIFAIIPDSSRPLFLDLTDLDYLNSSGVAILFSIFYRVQENHGHVAITGMHPFTSKVFSLMELPMGVPIYGTIEQALEDFNLNDRTFY